MTVRYIADEDIWADIIRGLRLREPTIDILDVKTSGLKGSKDPTLLELAAEQDRIMISHDRNSMTRHFYEHLMAGKSSPGLFIVLNERSAVGAVIDSLLLVWAASQAEEWRDRVVYLPFP